MLRQGYWSAFITIFVILDFNTIVDCLHLQQTQQSQLSYLTNIQNQYSSTIKNLITNSQNIEPKVQSTEKAEKKAQLLVTAVQQERSQISKLSYQAIPSSLEPSVQCQIISQSQRNSTLTKLNQIKSTIADLESLISQIKTCDQTQGINNELALMKLYMARIQNVEDNNCSQMYAQGPAIHQTNLQSSNWVLGQLTMDQLKQKYYQRANNNNNISNCPLNQPFFNGRACINCTFPNLYFNMSSNTCTDCGQGKSVNVSTHKCQKLPRNTNYTFGPNYVLAPLKLIPLPNQNLTSCNQNKPFFDGHDCISCSMPTHFWNISAAKCIQCPDNTTFNLNDKQCVTKIENKLTRLSGTNWVTNDGNITKVLHDRMQVLKQNQTSGKYQLCPLVQPFYDSVSCVFCNDQFNLDTLKCTSPPEGEKYDKNMRKYLVPSNITLQTAPNATNYITQNANLPDTKDIPNCNDTHPYYDQIDCIYCQKPFPIFNYDDNNCVACDPITFYNNTSHKCQQRQYVFIKGNQTRIIATNSTTLADYNQKLYDAIAQNPQKIPLQCTNISEYAAITKCVACTPNQYFNIEWYICQTCDGSVDPRTHLCHQKTHYVTNLQSNHIIIQNATEANNSQQEEFKKHDKVDICPLTTPFQNQNKTGCMNCTIQLPLYNVSSGKCVKCQENQKYNPSIKECKPILFLTNLSANVIVTPPSKIQQVRARQSNLQYSNFSKMCPVDKPYTSDNKLCQQCFQPFPLFNLTSGLCTACPSDLQYSNVTHQCAKIYYLTDLNASGILETENHTIQTEKVKQDQIKNSGKKYVQCSGEKPFGDESTCFKCLSNNSYFQLSTKTCELCPHDTQYWASERKCVQVTFFTNVSAGRSHIVQSDNYTIANIKVQQQKQKVNHPVKECPEQKPYASLTGCVQCNSSAPYFFLRTSSCYVCDNYKSQNNSCPVKPPRYPNMTHYQWVATQSTPDQIIQKWKNLKSVTGATQCPVFYNDKTRDCVQCPTNYYFNADTLKCDQCLTGTQFDINIHKCVKKEAQGLHYTNLHGTDADLLIYGGLTLNQLESKIADVKKKHPNSQFCPTQTPFFDTFQCIKCPEYKKYFNLRYQLCQVCLFDETLNTSTHNCDDKSGAAVWRKPSGQLVYPFLFK